MEQETLPELSTIWNEAKAYIEQGNYDKAIEIYKYVLIRYGENATAIEYASAYLADVYLTLREPERTQRYIKEAIKLKSEKPDYHYISGFAYTLQREWTKAIKEFKICLKAKSDNAEYLRGLGWAEINAGDRLTGIQNLLKAIEVEPADARILLDLANAYLLDLDFETAKQYAKKALHIDTGNDLARTVFDKICQFEKEYKRTKGKQSSNYR